MKNGRRWHLFTGCLFAIGWLLLVGPLIGVLTNILLGLVLGSSSPVPTICLFVVWIGGAVLVFWFTGQESDDPFITAVRTSSASRNPHTVSIPLTSHEGVEHMLLGEAIDKSRSRSAHQRGVYVKPFRSGWSAENDHFLLPARLLRDVEHHARGLVNSTAADMIG